MIINSMADGSVTKDDLIEFNFRPISYSISSNGTTLSGEVNAGEYADVDTRSLGPGPFTVELGYVNHSYQAEAVTVDSPDAMVTFWMAFPAGPNGPKSFIVAKQGD